MYPLFFDPTYLLVIIGFAICAITSINVKSTFSKYSKIRSNSNMTGCDIATMILRESGITDVTINHIPGQLSDNYNPINKTLNLSDATYNSTSVAALGVAAHECGHAIQHANNYAFLNIRKAIVPVVNIGSFIAWPLILIGLFFNTASSQMFINIGILAYSLVVLFTLITLPVEFNASNRAVRILSNNLDSNEVSMVRKVLGAAALTYVASAASAILSLLRILILSDRRN